MNDSRDEQISGEARSNNQAAQSDETAANAVSEVKGIPASLRAMHKGGNVYQIIDGQYQVVGGAYGQQLANLFAASSELLIVAGLLDEYSDQQGGVTGELRRIVNRARAAIAHAEGRTPAK